MKKNNEYKINVAKLLRFLWRCAIVILLVAVVAGVAALWLCRAPKSAGYTARACFLVQENRSEIKQGYYNDESFSVETSSVSNTGSVDTYCYISSAPATLDAVIAQAGLPYTADELSRMIEVKREDGNASTFTVLVRSNDREAALQIAQGFAGALPDELAELTDLPRVRVLDAGSVAASASGGLSVRKALGIAVAAAVLAAFVCAVKFVADDVAGRTTVRDADLEKLCPQIRVLAQAEGDEFDDPTLKRLRTNIRLSFAEDPSCRVVGITALCGGVEKDALAWQLANSFAVLGERVLLIDADLSARRLTQHVGLPYETGLSDVVQGRISAWEAARFCGPENTPFHFLGAGSDNEASSELLDDRRLIPILQGCVSNYDCILLDLEALDSSADAAAVARHIDGVLLYLKQDHCTRKQLADGLSQMELANANVLGFAVSDGVDTGKPRTRARR